MGICCGNARIAGSNQKNRWIVFFSQCAPQFSPSPTRVRKNRSTKVLPEFRTCTTLQRRAILCVLSYNVVHVRCTRTSGSTSVQQSTVLHCTCTRTCTVQRCTKVPSYEGTKVLPQILPYFRKYFRTKVLRVRVQKVLRVRVQLQQCCSHVRKYFRTKVQKIESHVQLYTIKSSVASYFRVLNYLSTVVYLAS